MQALFYAQRGACEWGGTPKRVRWVRPDPAMRASAPVVHQQVLRTEKEFAAHNARQIAQRIAERGYDRCDPNMTLRKMRAIPICRPEILLYG